MKSNCYSKSFLSVYKHLRPLTVYIDKIIENKSVNSFYERGDTFSVANNLIDLSQKKLLYINLKVILNNVFLSMSKDLAKILLLKYVDGLSSQGLCETLELQPRTMFRKLRCATEEFDAGLESEFEAKPNIFYEAIKDNWINSIYLNLENKKEGDQDVNINLLIQKKNVSKQNAEAEMCI